MRAGSDSLLSWLRRALLLGLALGALAAAAELAVQVLPLKHRLPDEVIPALRPLLAPNESINGYDTRLIVRASPATLKQIERVLEEIDTARRNLRISVRMGETLRSREQEAGISGEIRTGSTRVVVSPPARTVQGTTITTRGNTEGVKLHAERSASTREDSLVQTLTVLDGGKGFLRIGESVPMVQTYLGLIGYRPGLVAGIEYRDVTTGFDVEPRLLGDRIQLLLSPRLAFRSSRGSQIVELRDLSTQVTVPPGVWTEIGGMVESANAVNRTILSGQTRTRDDNNSFQVRVDPLP